MRRHIAPRAVNPPLILIAVAVMSLWSIAITAENTTEPAQRKTNPPAELVTVSPNAPTTSTMVRAKRADAPTSGPWRGGWRGGRQQPGRLIDTLARWHEIDGRLQENTRRFKETTDRRDKIMATLTQKKDSVQPGRMDPMAVMARKEIDRQLGELHTLIEVDRANNEETARLLRGAMITKDRWMPALTKLFDDSLAGKKITTTQRERMKRWKDGLAHLQRDDIHGFVDQVLGVQYGEYLIESVPMLTRRPQMPGGGGPPMPPMGGGRGEMQGRGPWLNRLSQLERQQAYLRQEMNRQDEEIARLRRMLDNPGREPQRPKKTSAEKAPEAAERK